MRMENGSQWGQCPHHTHTKKNTKSARKKLVWPFPVHFFLQFHSYFPFIKQTTITKKEIPTTTAMQKIKIKWRVGNRELPSFDARVVIVNPE